MADGTAQPVASKEFHYKEYESLKKEIADQVEHSRKLEIYAVGGIATFYAWFIHAQPTTSVILAIPMMLAILGALRSYATLTRIYEIAEYIRVAEKVLALRDNGLVGWETYRITSSVTKDQVQTKSSSPFLSSAAVFWFLLIGISVAAWWLPCIFKNHP